MRHVNLSLVFAAFVAMLAAAMTPAAARGPQSVAPVAEGLLPAVVNISTSTKVSGPKRVPLPDIPKGSPFDKFFDDFFKRRGRGGQSKRSSSLGSGFVIDPSGLVVTNNHVIKGADEIVVNFPDGSKLTVDKVLGVDPKTDLALLKVTPKAPLPFVKWGDSSKMRVGDWVMAIGNPFGLGGSLSVGVISATKRDINSGPYDEFLQTDAAINKGNSGGPLFNMSGEVIGVNTAIISPTGGSIGIGFSVPAATATYVIDQLQKYGETRRGYLGVRIQSVTDDIAASLGMAKARGALVSSVTDGSPSANAGIKVSDVIVTFDGKPVPTMRALPRIVARTPIDKTVDVVVLRGGKEMTLQVTVERLKEKSAKTASLNEDKPEEAEQETSDVLGMTLSAMNDDLRRQFQIGASVNGVVVTEVAPDSAAADKGIRAGDVIGEVTQVSVTAPADVVKRIEALREAGRESALLLISNAQNELRFVAVPIKTSDPEKKP